MFGGMSFDQMFQRGFTEKDSARVLHEFEGALDTAATRDGGSVLNLAVRVWEHFSSIDADKKHKMLAGAALLYFIVPTDLIPDTTPLLGYADDVLVLSLVLRQLSMVGQALQTARSLFRERYGI